MEILNILEINEVLSSMTLQLKLQVDWRDPRLTFLNLKTENNLNTLSSSELNEIWVPSLVFTNTKKRMNANFRNETTFGTISINEGTNRFIYQDNRQHTKGIFRSFHAFLSFHAHCAKSIKI